MASPAPNGRCQIKALPNGNCQSLSPSSEDPHTPNKKARVSPALITAAEIQTEFAHHDPDVARINNGSFGCCPASLISAQRHWQMLFLRQPDRFYFHSLSPSVLRSRSLLAPLVNARHPDHLSLVDNATTAAAIVLQSLSRSFSPGDSAIILHHSYGAVKKSVHAYVSSAGGRVVEARLPFPVASPGEIVSSFSAALAGATGRVRLAVIDHVTSMPSVVLPVRELVRACREGGVERVLVDAAHGIGCVEVDVEAIGADFYTSNLHKWLFCPPSVAFLHHAPASSADLHHPVVSHEYGNGLPVESAWVGTRDYSPQLVIPEVLEFLDRFPGGMDGVRRRNHERVVEMGQMLAAAWGTHLGCPPEMCSSMAMVGLPDCLGVRSDADALSLRAHLRDAFRVEVPIYYRPRGEEEEKDRNREVVSAYARISHQVYNKPEDYYRFRDAITRLVQTGFSCASLSH